MKTFHQWLAERGVRTGLGIYPPAYSTRQGPPLDKAPVSAGHLNAFATIHGGEHPELLSKPIRNAWDKNKANAPQVLKKNPWKDSFDDTET